MRLLLGLVLLLLSARPAAAEGHLIEGLVVNGTLEGTPVAGAEVELFGLAEGFGRFVPLGTRRTDEEGRFRFSGFDATYDRYGVTIDYLGVPYQSELAALDDSGHLRLEVTAYETTTDPSAVSLQRVHILVEGEGSSLRLSEILLLTNPGRRTVVPPTRDGFLFPLPPGAAGVELADPRLATTARTTPQGIYDVTAIPPGGKQMLYSYTLPPGPFSRSYPFAVESLAVFLPSGGPALTQRPAGMIDAGPFTAQTGQTYQRYEQDGLAAGREAALVITLAGASGQRDLAPWLGGGAVLLLAGLGAWLWRGGRLPGLGRPQPSVDGRELLLVMMADLDASYARGQVSEEAHREERRGLKSELRRLLAGLPPGPSSAAAPRPRP